MLKQSQKSKRDVWFQQIMRSSSSVVIPIIGFLSLTSHNRSRGSLREQDDNGLEEMSSQGHKPASTWTRSSAACSFFLADQIFPWRPMQEIELSGFRKRVIVPI